MARVTTVWFSGPWTLNSNAFIHVVQGIYTYNEGNELSLKVFNLISEISVCFGLYNYIDLTIFGLVSLSDSVYPL